MIRLIAVLMILASPGVCQAADGDQPPVVTSWDHYRDLMIEDGKTGAEADRRITELLGSLNDMDRSAGADRIGVVAPSFEFDGWLNSESLTLHGLRGQVVLVRWWTETCPFCASSAPALRALNQIYGPQGLVVVGVYHPKANRDSPLDMERVERAVEARALDFPIAVDWDWRNGTLADWWLTGPDRPATSVTFLLDRQGVIQYVHPGMEYHEANGAEGHAQCANDMVGIRAAIERLLAEPVVAQH
jgi:peroxiredoxin